MIKRILTTAALSLCLLCAWGNPVVDNEPRQAPAQEQVLPDGERVVQPITPPSEETNTLEESAVARKMTQAEKNENAKENDSWGGAITLIAMTVVLSALIVLSVLFMLFGKVSSRMLSHKKKQAKVSNPVVEHTDEDHDVDSGETIAAIAMALAEHFGQTHDMEDTILTIRHMKKSYSPWNSKIYNLREFPAPAHNPASHSAFKKH